MKNNSMLKRMIRAAIGDSAVEADSIASSINTNVGDNAFVNLVAGLGTIRDKASASEYMPVKRKDVKGLSNTYHQDWIAKRIINKPSYDAMRAGWYYGKVDADTNRDIINASKKLKLHKTVLKALALSRLHGWSYVLVGVNNDEDLAEPLDIGIGDLGFFTVLKRDQVVPKKDGGYVSASETMGSFTEPEFYQIGDNYNPKYIHHSRLIRFETPDPVGGDDGMPMPILQHIYETLMRHASVSANASSLVYESKVDIIRMPDLMTNLMIKPMSAITSMMQRFTSIATLKGNNGMIVLDKEEEYDSKSFSFTGLPELMREFAVQTAGAAEMPFSLLFGQSPSGMNATGDFDMRSYYDSINTMQENVLRDPLERIVSLILESLGYQIDDIGLVFNTLWQLDDKTKSEVEKNNAERDSKYLENGVITEYHIARQLVDDGTYTTIDEEHIETLKMLEANTSELENEAGSA